MSKGQIVGINWNRIARLHSHVLAHMNSLTASRCHINASHMNSLTASRRHIKAYQDAFFRVYVSPRIYVVYHVVVISLLVYSLRRVLERFLFTCCDASTNSPVRCGHSFVLGSLSTRVFETRTAAGSELFSLLTFPHRTTFPLLSIFFPLEMSSIKIWKVIRS